jgi:all-trans-8'-apo-beta-carotenal 15,15'-oxygenase
MKAWSKSLEKPALEFSETNLTLLAGKIPDGLRGSLYRNGPGRLARGNQKVGHWFDGDGAILAAHFTDTGAKATYRYVQTKGYQQESQANQYLFPNYGMNAPRFFWNNWGKEVKNAANTSVLALSDKLLALWEGGFPHKLDLQSLETFGLDDLASLQREDTFSAHPKVDLSTGEIFNFGVKISAKISLNLYKSDSTGQIIQRNAFDLGRLSLLHDFVLAGKYLVFFIPPIKADILSILLGFKTFSDAMQWQPSLGTRILIFDRDSLSLVSESVTDAWFQWHFANGCLNEQGNIEIVFVRYDDFNTNQFLKEVATGKTETLAIGKLAKITLNPQSAAVINQETLVDISCDFPVTSPQLVSKPWQKTFLAVHRPDSDNNDLRQEILGLPACYDHSSGKLSIANLEDNCYGSEPIFVTDGLSPETGWLIVVVYNGNNHSSEVRIYDSQHLENEPLCCLQLPSVIPHGFHGTWQEKA